MRLLHKILIPLLLANLFTNFAVFANEVSEKSNNSEELNNGFSWQITGSIATVYYDSLLKDGPDPSDLDNQLAISLFFDLYYKGFFIQSNQRRSDGLFGNAELGYQIKVTNDWSLELISSTYVEGFIPEEVIKNSKVKKEDSILNGLSERNASQGLGLRYSHFIGDDILSFDIARIVSTGSSNNWVMELYYSHFIPFRNWSIYTNAGITYLNKDTINYYVGIDPNEVNDKRSYYQTDSDGFELEFDVTALYPLAEKWTLNVGAKYDFYSKNVERSPIINKRGDTLFTLGVMYVF